MLRRRMMMMMMGGRAFTGALDAYATSMVHLYDPARRWLSAYTGNLLRLRRASDNAESDFTYTATGELDLAAIATWAGGASYVVTLYDQKGSDNVTQAVAANQPLFVASGQNSHAVMRGDGTDYLASGATSTFKNAGAGSLVVVSTATGVTGTQFILTVAKGLSLNSMRAVVCYSLAEIVAGGRRLDSDSMQIATGGAHTVNVFGIYQARFDWTNSNLYALKNGSQVAEKTDFQTDGVTSNTDSGGIGIFADVAGSAATKLTGDIGTAIVLSSSAVATGVVAALNTYWAVY